jgi:hypothetical protein
MLLVDNYGLVRYERDWGLGMTGKMPVLRDWESFEFVGAGLADDFYDKNIRIKTKPALTEF